MPGKKNRWPILTRGVLTGVLLAPPLVIAQPPAPSPEQQPPAAQPLNFREDLARGVAQMKAGNFDAAIATFQDLISKTTDPRLSGELWAALGETYRAKGDLPSAIWSLGKAFVLLPGSTAIATSMGMIYEQSHDAVHARQAYAKAISIDPGNVLALNNLAYLLAASGEDLELALRYAHAAQLKRPDVAAFNDTAGWVYLKKNMPDEAIENFRSAIRQEPASAEYHYHLALALFNKGQVAETADECRIALANKPGYDLEKDIRNLMAKTAAN
jgi:tetratricopeptide (TPR) repeat protein